MTDNAAQMAILTRSGPGDLLLVIIVGVWFWYGQLQNVF